MQHKYTRFLIKIEQLVCILDLKVSIIYFLSLSNANTEIYIK